MSSRETILRSIRNQIVPSVDMPELDREWITYEDRLAQFQSVLEMVGGQAAIVEGQQDLQQAADAIPTYTSAKKTVSCVGGIRGNVNLQDVDDPHALEDIDYAVVPGEFAVAENGAVWVTDASLRQRTILFLPQHLAIVVPFQSEPTQAIVDNMYQAYQRLNWENPPFGCFISGPSKTADIEQSLVIGAHGARSLHVLFVRS